MYLPVVELQYNDIYVRIDAIKIISLRIKKKLHCLNSELLYTAIIPHLTASTSTHQLYHAIVQKSSYNICKMCT